MGGDPDLPEDFAWPERPPPPDALRRAQAIEQRGRAMAQRFEEIRPGVTPWRHIFSWGAERYQGTRCMATKAGDGARYVLMHEDDLNARRFDRVRNTHQRT
jgi:hypothetical protein